MVPDGFDPERWVIVTGHQSAPERCLLGERAHTHYGRIHAWCVEHETFVTISKGDIIDASPLALAWIDGFLAGSEPELHEYLGISRDEGSYIEDRDPAIARWRTDMAAARQRGWMPPLPLRPGSGVPADAEHLEPWCWVGGEFWQWRNGTWSVIAPAPAGWDGSSLVPSICDTRGYCDLALYGSWAICTDCGQATEVEHESDTDAEEPSSDTP